MGKAFEELDFQRTPLGELSLRRREIPQLGGLEVYEVKLGEEYLMSSLFHEVEVALADLGLADLTDPAIDVVVGGLGLGYTARAALRHEKVRSVRVVEALEAVIGWHERGLVPLGRDLTNDARCGFVQGDFFALAADPARGFHPDEPGKRVHAILLDIDHSPRKLLHARHASFYERGGLQALREHLLPGGVFALWSDDAPDEEFLDTMKRTFDGARAQVVTFHNPLQDREARNTVYLARR